MIWTPHNPIFLPKKRTGKVHVASELKNFGWRTLRKRRQRERERMCRDYGYRKYLRRRGGFAGGYPCCDGCQEVSCLGGACTSTIADLEAEIVLSDIANDGCTSCANYNATYVLAYIDTIETETSCIATWDIDVSEHCEDGADYIQFKWGFDAGSPTWFARVFMSMRFVGGVALVWIRRESMQITCEDISSYNISPLGSAPWCDHTSSTALATLS